MTSPDTLQFVSAGCALVAAACAILAAHRAGKWRATEAAQKLVAKVGTIENDMKLHAQRLDQLENDVKDLPTRADIARVEGAIDRTCAIADRTEAAVNRLQDYLMHERT